MKNLSNTVIKNGFCIGCGVCSAIDNSPFHIKLNKFGMYEAEHAVTLRNSGFEGFRTIFFEQKSGLAQAKDDEGLSFNEYFFLSFLNSALAGDALNDLTSQIRPYEVESGMTNKAMSNVLERMRECMRSKEYHAWEGSVSAKILDRLIKDANPSQLERVLDQLFSDHYLSALRDCAQILNNEIEVDYAQPKVSCKIVGEFWAQMAEGEGNFNMFAFLESNGADVIIEPIINWLAYLLEIARFKTADAGEVWDPDLGKWDLVGKMGKEYHRRQRLVLLNTFFGTMKREFNRIRKALGEIPRPICPQREIRKLAEPYYNKNIMGGEGYLEIGKTIYYSINNMAHLILGLKPFGCLPSTQSDAAMVAVTAQYPEILYLPIETSGEGDINAYSRVQMILTEAKKRAREEFNDCVKKTGYSIEEIRKYCSEHRELRKPLQKIPQHDGVTGRGANFVLHVGKLMRKSR